MPSTKKDRVYQRYNCPRLPLAVYREVAAHLRQIIGVDAGLIVKPLKCDRETFDYHASQIESLWLEYSSDLSPVDRQRIQAILDYYGKRYQPWELIESVE